VTDSHHRLVGAALLLSGCASIAGLDDRYVVGETSTGAATQTGTGGTATAGATGGAAAHGGTGATSTAGGTGGAAGAGTGSPTGTTGGAGGGGGATTPVDCLAIKTAQTSATDGDYTIDPDGPGGIAPFVARCDMTIDDGGWTRFHWLGAAYVAGTDPLGQILHQCDVTDTTCLARIPAAATPTQLLVKDVSDSTHAAWTFGGSALGTALLAALRDKTQYCGVDINFLSPYLSTSPGTWCGSDGTCDSFVYTDGSCGGFSDWTMMFDDDGYWCRTAFKMGATFGDGSWGNDCGAGDHAYLDDCECSDEFGELYYR